jgi:alkylation response protein AidB-like acyl-CoA dehydrogenase
LASGKKLGAFCITEPEAGSDATATKATAKKDGDYYILNGTKTFCSNGEAAEIYSLFFSTNPARGARGITCFVVEKGTKGFGFGKKETKMGIRASSTYELTLTVPAPASPPKRWESRKAPLTKYWRMDASAVNSAKTFSPSNPAST